jgi:predicted RNA-binding Zn-ribbon protein involved in translation (DUF1610 family)
MDTVVKFEKKDRGAKNERTDLAASSEENLHPQELKMTKTCPNCGQFFPNSIFYRDTDNAKLPHVRENGRCRAIDNTRIYICDAPGCNVRCTHVEFQHHWVQFHAAGQPPKRRKIRTGSNEAGSSSGDRIKRTNEDAYWKCPITLDTMIDPVICNDGLNYCRWSISKIFLKGETFLGFNGEVHSIEKNNDLVRRYIFEKYPEQEKLCQEMRNAHKTRLYRLLSDGDYETAQRYFEFMKLYDNKCEDIQLLLDGLGHLTALKDIFKELKSVDFRALLLDEIYCALDTTVASSKK